jgi:choloylglycine hydrolase
MTAAVTALTSALALPVSSLACTTFCLLSEDRIILGKNYDWHIATGLLFVNKRGVERSDQPARDPGKDWVSKFGSVTFNQYGRDQPAGGMNEVGLVVEIMWMNGTVFPEPDHRAAVTGTSWVQYQLDTARSVSDVIASNAEVRISRSAAPLHYLVADRSGEVAVIEFRDGDQIVYRGTTLPVPALANDFYADALKFSAEADKAGLFGDRFTRAARSIRAYPTTKNGDPVAYAFTTLADVAQKKGQATSGAPAGFPPATITQWSMVYEIDALRVHFRTEIAPTIKSLSLTDIDFSCATPVKMLDLNEATEGDVRARLLPYTREANLALIRTAFSQTVFLRGLPDKELDRVASRPEEGSCTSAIR